MPNSGRAIRTSDRLRSRGSPRSLATGPRAKVRYQEKPARDEYRLTEKGRDLHPVIISLPGWGDRWIADENGPPLTLRHKACGHTMHPTLVCRECREPVGPRDVTATLTAPARSRA